MVKEVLKKTVKPKCKPCPKKPIVKKVVKKSTVVKKVDKKPVTVAKKPVTSVRKAMKKPVTIVKKVIKKPVTVVKKVIKKPVTVVKKVIKKPIKVTRKVVRKKPTQIKKGMIGGRQILRYDNVRLKDHLANKLGSNTTSENNNDLGKWNKVALGTTLAAGLTTAAINTYNILKSSGSIDKIKNAMSPSGNNVNSNFNNLVSGSNPNDTQTQVNPIETQTQVKPIETQTQVKPIESQSIETQTQFQEPIGNQMYSEYAPVRAIPETEEDEEYKRQRYQQEINNDQLNIEREKAKINQVLEYETKASTDPQNLSAKVEYYQDYINDKKKLLELKKEKMNKKMEEDAIINKRHAILRKQNRDRLQRGFDQDPNRRGYVPGTTKGVQHPNSWNNSSR